MNGNQLEGVLKNWLAKENPNYSAEDSYHEFMYKAESYLNTEPVTMQSEVVNVSLVEIATVGEYVFPADGGEIYVVLKIDTDGHVQYFKRNGWYQSFVGSEWNDEWVEVFPKEKTVVVYE